jgi:predicted amidophosphoribosyltransferase
MMSSYSLTYNWNQYFDEVSKGDIVFTYFTGPGEFSAGIYLISRVIQIDGRSVVGKIKNYNVKEPLVPPDSFEKFKSQILTRNRGSVFVIPPFADAFFENVYRQETTSELDIPSGVDCQDCHKGIEHAKCSWRDLEYLVNWPREVVTQVPGYTALTAAYWIVPRQAHWLSETSSTHRISSMFYAFKAGYMKYALMFATGIELAIRRHPSMKGIAFDAILSVPLSPEKKENGEPDRVSEICKILSGKLGVPYLENGLILSKHVSRTQYKKSGKGAIPFKQDYSSALSASSKVLEHKILLIVDDVITDGLTLRVVARKLRATVPDCSLFAATAGIMAKKTNLRSRTLRKFSR